MFERFTDRARRVTVLAQEEARKLKHNYIGTEHFLLGLIQEGEGVAFKVLDGLGVKYEPAHDWIAEVVGDGVQAPSGHIPFTPRAKKVLELSLREALQLGHPYIGTEHLLLGIVREGEGIGMQTLEHLGRNGSEIRQATIRFLASVGLADQDNQVEEGLLLTPNERRVIEKAGELWNAITAAVPEGSNRDQDLAELIGGIHLIQRYFMAQAATRAYPGEYRALGKSLRD